MKMIVLATALAVSVLSCNVLAATNENAAVSATTASSSATSDNQEFSSSQKAAIRHIMHEYLVQHPEVLIEAAHALQAKQAQQQQAQAMNAITQNKEKLFKNQLTPVGGNPNGNVMLVEFFDYQCGHCKAMQPVIAALISKNPQLKVIYDELPIFGENSEFAAKAALAAAKQGKFKELHQALFAANEGLTAEKVMAIAKSIGLNVAQLSKDMQDPLIEKQVKENFNLAQELHLVGTPSFILTNHELTKFDFVPGATSEEDMQQRINQLERINQLAKSKVSS